MFSRLPARAIIAWPDETEEARSGRRDRLCRLDGLLTYVEELNLRGIAEIRPSLYAWAGRLGVGVTEEMTGADLVEAIFAEQERLMLQPIMGRLIDGRMLPPLSQRSRPRLGRVVTR